MHIYVYLNLYLCIICCFKFLSWEPKTADLVSSFHFTLTTAGRKWLACPCWREPSLWISWSKANTLITSFLLYAAYPYPRPPFIAFALREQLGVRSNCSKFLHLGSREFCPLPPKKNLWTSLEIKTTTVGAFFNGTIRLGGKHALDKICARAFWF